MNTRIQKLLLSMVIFCLIGLVYPISSLAQTSTTYTVQPGDSLWKISVRYQIGLTEIIEANPQIQNPDLIYPQQKVNIPVIDRIKAIEHDVIQLCNQERAKHGLAPLRADWELSRVARHKSQDMRDKGYFSHQSPTYGSPFDMMRAYGITYRAAGENIAMGQRTAQQVVQGWMNSQGHRQNILSQNYTHIGVGFVEGSSGPYWTQLFLSK
ncbi:SafA/ExsA family spore coat assembly protein [Bacillus horti]|uniref:YkwD family protein/spore coat assembly protein SafA n=1 Tax=Caldalkalibacillus horti TaxID=77523 RepID=A0ABT9W3M7_9BACI|nr:SafA/ExsA family spore coat assembly protein [Bacillus horti]MDQ0167856.1 putative YkwD family protein/spore coat assembly protein SafA [Bacillus horti]